jgi:hypothetical protein
MATMIEVPPARIPEESGAAIPHAGICEGGVWHLVFLSLSVKVMKPPKNHARVRRLALAALCAGGSVCFCGCSAMVDSLMDGASDRRAEKRYQRDGATPREAKQMVFEDDFFKDVGGRP